ncbi:MAG: cardiolipin synthase [Actinobacteria bacterium]|nr:cardiolipin synthase [Actinomycetota bacterium]
MSSFSLAALLPGWLEILFFIYWTFTIVLLIMDDREPSITLAWIFILVFLPVIGVFFYIFFGRDWKVVAQRKGWIQTLKRVETEEMAPIYQRNTGATGRFVGEWAGTIAVPVSRAITSENVSTVLPAASVELFVTGKAKFARLKEDLAGAQRFIHLQYFIWEQDRLTAELVPILLDRLKAGVEVRIMYDWMGCISFKKRELKQLARAGALVRADVTDLLRINYRNHRKIVVIDGEIGYTGGMNVGQEYIDGGERFATWRDTHLRLTGQAVAGLEKLYASRWFEHKKDHEDLFTEQYMPAPDQTAVDSGTLIEIAAQGVEDPWSAARRAHMVAIGQAEESVWIQSPYFVPDYSVYDVMINAALSGIDVRFMMTGVPDKRLPYYAAQTYYRKLIEAGGKVYKYEAGFFHSKTIVVDGLIGAVGTMNMDQRSLKLHKELMCWVFDRGFAQQCTAAFLADMENCHEVTLDDVLSVGRLRRFRNQAARLLSNVL